MASVGGEDVTLPLDFNACSNMSRLTDISTFMESSCSRDRVTGDKTSPMKPWMMKDYENQITDLKKENFNLKLRIYFLEERMQQKFDGASEDIHKTNIELKVEVESLKHDLQEKQALLVKASKAVESLAENSSEVLRVKEECKKDLDQVTNVFHKKIEQLEESLKAAQTDADQMAIKAEQEKLKNLDLEKRLVALTGSQPPRTEPELCQRLDEQDRLIEKLNLIVKDKDVLIEQLRNDKLHLNSVGELTEALERVNGETEALRIELKNEKMKHEKEIQNLAQRQNDPSKVDSAKKMPEELEISRTIINTLKKSLEEMERETKVLRETLEEKENELNTEKKNGLKKDKAIQGFTLLLKEKENEIEELCHTIEDRDDALGKAREAAHKAQIQKYQGAEQNKSLLTEKETELAKLLSDHQIKVMENQKLQRTLSRKEQELSYVHQTMEQLEKEIEDLQQEKNKGDKFINDLRNQLKKLKEELGEKERNFEQQHQSLLNENKHKLQSQELTIKRLMSSLNEKEQLLQEYMKMVTFSKEETNSSSDGKESLLAKLRERLKEKDHALQQAIDDKFASIDDKDNEIQQLLLSLREKERDLDRLGNLLSHNQEMINSLEAVLKEKDMELQHLENSYKNLQRTKQDLEDNRTRSLREKDVIISQLERSLANKNAEIEEMANTLLNSNNDSKDLASQLSQRLKISEAMLAEVMKDKERLLLENEAAVEGLLNTISYKDKIMKESSERYNQSLADRNHEIQDLRKQLLEKQQELSSIEKHSLITSQENLLETAELKALLADKDTIINKLVESAQERDKYLTRLSKESAVPQAIELKHTIQILQEQLKEKEAEIKKTCDDRMAKAQKKSSTIILKKELAQKEEALSKALQKETDLQTEVADLRSLLKDLEIRYRSQTENIESLSKSLAAKDESILELRLKFRNISESVLGKDHSQKSAVEYEDKKLPHFPQKLETQKGVSSEEALPNLEKVIQEYNYLNNALKKEQQLYVSLASAIKQPYSIPSIQNLQVELDAVHNLRQQLEEGIKSNEELRHILERELQRARRREDAASQTIIFDHDGLHSLKHQMEETHQYNGSAKTRDDLNLREDVSYNLNETSDIMSFIGDDTAYMSICVKEHEEWDSVLNNLSEKELKRRIIELLNTVKELQAANKELQNKVNSESNPSEAETLVHLSRHKMLIDAKLKNDEQTNKDICDQDNKNNQKKVHWSLEKNINMEITREGDMATYSTSKNYLIGYPQASEEELPSDCEYEQNLPHNQLESTSCRPQTVNIHQNKSEDIKRYELEIDLRFLLAECGLETLAELRSEIQRLKGENAHLTSLFKRGSLMESKDKSKDSKEERGKYGHHQVSRKGMEQLVHNSSIDGERNFNTDLIVNIPRETEILNIQREVCNKGASSQEEAAKNTGQKTTVSENAFLPRNPSKSRLAPSRTPTKSRLPVRIKANKMNSAIDAANKTAHYWCADPIIVPQTENHQSCLQEKNQFSKKLDRKLSVTESFSTNCRSPSPSFIPSCSLNWNASSETENDWKKCNESPQVKDDFDHLDNTLVCDETCLQDVSQDMNNFQQVEQLLTTLKEKDTVIGKLEDKLQRTYMSGTKSIELEFQQQITELQKIIDQKDAQLKELEQSCHVTDSAQNSNWEVHSHQGHILKLNKNLLCLGCCEKLINVPLFVPSVDNMDTDLSLQVSKLRKNSGETLFFKTSEDWCSAQSALTTKNVTTQTSGFDSKLLEDQFHNLLGKKNELSSIGNIQATIADPTSNDPNTSAVVCNCSSGQAICPEVKELQNALREKANYCKELEEKVFMQESNAICAENQNVNNPRHPDKSGVENQDNCVNYELQSSVSCENLDVNEIVQLQQQVLHLQNELQEKITQHKELQERLIEAEITITLQNAHLQTKQARTSLGQDDKEVQVELQDLGYDTGGKSESDLDREENSSSGHIHGMQQCNNISILSLLQTHDQSCMENMDTPSSNSYPSSLSSPKINIRSPEVFDDYGHTDDPAQLQHQVKELKEQLESYQKAIHQLQSYLHKNSLSVDLSSVESGLSQHSQTHLGDHEDVLDNCQNSTVPLDFVTVRHSPDNCFSVDHVGHDQQMLKEQIVSLQIELDKERASSKIILDQLQQMQSKIRSSSPARFDSLIQSQARELSRLRQQIKEARTLILQHHHQLDNTKKSFEDLLQASDVDYYLGKTYRQQLYKSLELLDKVVDALENISEQSDNEDRTTHQVVKRFTKEVKEKNKYKNKTNSQSICSKLHTTKITNNWPPSQNEFEGWDQQYSSVEKSKGTQLATQLEEEDRSKVQSIDLIHPGSLQLQDEEAHVSLISHTSPASRQQVLNESLPSPYVLQRQNNLLTEKLKNTEELNETLRSELDLHRSIITSGNQGYFSPKCNNSSSAANEQNEQMKETKCNCLGAMNMDLIAEHLQEIRKLRQRLEESIKTNDRLQEQLERRLAEAEPNLASTNIFIHDSEEQNKLTKEINFLWVKNQALKEQLTVGSRDKQKENEKLKESLAKKNAKLEHLRNEYERLKKENIYLKNKADTNTEENKHLKDVLYHSRNEINRLQREINMQQQQLADNQHLLQSLRVELQVYEQLKVQGGKSNDIPLEQNQDVFMKNPGQFDLSELLTEMRHLRIQLERSIQTNNALRQKLEEQLLREQRKNEGSASTININYLLGAQHKHSETGTHRDISQSSVHHDLENIHHNLSFEKEPLIHGRPVPRQDITKSFHCTSEAVSRIREDVECSSQHSDSSSDSTVCPPSRLVPGHHLWADRNGRHVLGLIEDYSALQKQISEGKILTHGMDRDLQQFFHTILKQGGESKMHEQRFMKGFSSNVSTMQQILEEASRLLKLLWRVSLPSNVLSHIQLRQNASKKNEISRLQNKLAHQEQLLSNTAKCLRTTNQMKDGMEISICDLLSKTFNVLQRAKSNLEALPAEKAVVSGN
ncbi:CDK5 regulatory subunit-associated protein 2 isoform X2 [Polypterus senegalus]|uniref:CDK5 regulatory subunit-associated protein 2 isoform X2 n=1 Tax=Polypterus senegalus TaxID=55291 RepID=UPI00196656E7|nr:CDK5 regulatory subunit-associated protein 2 isoform X2 [Polypterus senegalus]